MILIGVDELEKRITDYYRTVRQAIGQTEIKSRWNIEPQEVITNTSRFDHFNWSLPKYYFEDIKRGAGIASFYSIHDYQKDWSSLFGKYYLYIAYRGFQDGLHRCFTWQEKYIRSLIINPTPSLFEPEGWVFNFFRKQFPYRDQVLHSENVFLVGVKLLSNDTIGEYSGVDLLWKSLLEKLETEIEFKHSIDVILGKEIQDLESEIYKEIIYDSWDLMAHLHEIGRSNREVIEIDNATLGKVGKRTKDAISSINIGEKVIRGTKEIIGHGAYTAAILLNLFEEIQISLDTNSQVALLLALDGIAEHNKILEDLEGIDKHKIENVTKDKWKNNPLGTFLATVILLEEIGARICWYSVQKKHDFSKWSDWDPQNIKALIPIQKVELYLEDEKAILQFFPGISQPEVEVAIPLEIDPPEEVKSVIATVFGPDCLKLLTRDQATHFNIKVEAEEQDESKIKKRELAGKKIEDEVEKREWPEFCKKNAKEAEEAVKGAGDRIRESLLRMKPEEDIAPESKPFEKEKAELEIIKDDLNNLADKCKKKQKSSDNEEIIKAALDSCRDKANDILKKNSSM